MRQAVLLRRPERAGEDLAVLGPHVQPAGQVEEPAPRLPLERLPELVRPVEQGHVVGVLEVGQPDHARLAVRAAAVVARREAVEAEHLRPATGEMVEGRASRAARPDDDAVVVHGDTLSHGGDTVATG